MPPNPPSKAHGFAMRSMSLCDMQIPKSEKKNSWPPPSNPGDAPVQYLYLSTYLSVLDVLEYLVFGIVKVLVLVLVLDQKVLGT